MLVNPLDRAALRARFRAAEPFPFVLIDDFLDRDFAHEVARSYPDYAEAETLGRAFDRVNERGKVQICNYARFPEPVRRLADALAAPAFREALTEISGIPDLIWDDSYEGGGMHQTRSRGLLDVHVDFNRLDRTGNYRRLNLLLYLNPGWSSDWGGALELWDREVRTCCHTIEPILNRCVIFETSERSFHGVTRLTCPPAISRKSFALYFYTREGAPGIAGGSHSTLFKARPDERLKKHLLMPAEQLEHRLVRAVRAGKSAVKRIIGRD